MRTKKDGREGLIRNLLPERAIVDVELDGNSFQAALLNFIASQIDSCEMFISSGLRVEASSEYCARSAEYARRAYDSAVRFLPRMNKTFKERWRLEHQLGALSAGLRILESRKECNSPKMGHPATVGECLMRWEDVRREAREMVLESRLWMVRDSGQWSEFSYRWQVTPDDKNLSHRAMD
jgi:hypothetical protein